MGWSWDPSRWGEARLAVQLCWPRLSMLCSGRVTASGAAVERSRVRRAGGVDTTFEHNSEVVCERRVLVRDMYACLYLPPRPITHRTQDATRALVHLARKHSPRIELQGQNLVVLDVHGMGRLWGSPREIGATLRRMAADRGLMIRVAVAATRMAALLATQRRSGLTVIAPGSEAAVLAPLPLTTLKQLAQAQASGSSTSGVGRVRVRSSSTKVASASPDSLALPALMLLPIVRRWGLKTLGELAALPADELSEAFRSRWPGVATDRPR